MYTGTAQGPLRWPGHPIDNITGAHARPPFYALRPIEAWPADYPDPDYAGAEFLGRFTRDPEGSQPQHIEYLRLPLARRCADDLARLNGIRVAVVTDDDPLNLAQSERIVYRTDGNADDDMLNVVQAADRLGVSREAIRRAIVAKQLPAEAREVAGQPRPMYYVRRADLEMYRESRHPGGRPRKA